MKPLSIAALLDKLEAFYGVQEPCWPVDPYEFLIWWHCGYPASDTTCTKGWNALSKELGIEPGQILKATQEKLAHALKAGGMVPELRAMRLQQIAERVENEFGGDLRNALVGRIEDVRKKLKKFPNIADPGADRILAFRQGRASCGGALELPACAGAHSIGTGAGELPGHIRRGKGVN